MVHTYMHAHMHANKHTWMCSPSRYEARNRSDILRCRQRLKSSTCVHTYDTSLRPHGHTDPCLNFTHTVRNAVCACSPCPRAGGVHVVVDWLSSMQ